jgi:hypothetical protein
VRQVAAWWLARAGLRSDLFVQMAYRLAQPDSGWRATPPTCWAACAT